VRFGDGAWHGTQAVPLFAAPMTPLCAPALAERVKTPEALSSEVLLRSYRADDWPDWFAATGLTPPPIRGPVFDSSWVMVEAAMQGAGVALAPSMMFARDLEQGRLVRPFALEVGSGMYWLTWLKSRAVTPALVAFRDWMAEQAA
jgi:LysR family transcriptional regulator of beta-lactamase